MIERQTINGRGAEVSYFTINPKGGLLPADKDEPGVYAKILWDDDGEMIILRMPGRKRERLLKQVDEHEAFRKRRMAQALPRSTSVETPRETKSARVSRAETWKDALKIIDASEPEVRDIIERGLIVRGNTYGERVLQTNSIVEQIAAVRMKAFKKAFRLVRDKGV